jgi:phage portal protein BeeE
LLYSIFIPSPTGDLIKTSPGASASTGTAPWSNVPLGNPFTDAFRGQRAPSKGELIQQLVGTAYACADLNAGAVAANPFRLMVRTGGTKGGKVRFWRTRAIGRRKAIKLRAAGYDVADGEVEEVVPDPTDPTRTHPLLQLLARPTRDPNGIGSYDLRYCTQLYLESLGTAYWWIPKNRLGTPDQIWLLRGHMVREVPDYEGSQLIAYYLYGRQEIPADEIIKFSVPDPYTLYYGGYSPLLASIEKIRIGRKNDAHVGALLDNMGRPDAMLIPKGGADGEGIGAEEARRWRAMTQAEFRRAGRGGLMVSEFPGSLEVLGWKPQDIVEIERATAIKTDICNCFGVPDALLERNASNLASAKTADYSHAKYAVNPRCVRMSETLNEKLVKLFDPTGSLFLVYDNPIPDDEVFELEVTKAGAQQGITRVDEFRAAIGLDPLGGPAGEMRYMPSTLVPVGEDGKPILPPPPPAPEKPAGPDGDKPTPAEKPDAAAKLLDRTLTLLDVITEKMSASEVRQDENVKMLVSLANRLAFQEKEHARIQAAPDGNGVRDGRSGQPEPVAGPIHGDAEPVAGGGGPVGTDGDGEVGHGEAKAIDPSDEGAGQARRAAGAAGGDDEGRDGKAPRLIGNRDPNTGLAGPLPQGDELLHVLRGLFHEQAKAILDELHTKDAADEVATKAFWEGKGRFGLPDRFKGLGEWVGKMADAVTTYLEAYIVTGGRTLIQRIGVSLGFDRVVNPEVTEAAKRLALKFSESTNETTTMQLDQALDALREELAEGLEAGDGRVELRKRVQEVFDKADVERAETIARTEASRATHEGELIAAKKSGVVKRKSWLASADACDECEALSVASADGIELDTPFTVTKYGTVDGPPLHPNCQCSTTYVLKDAEEITATAAGTEEQTP